MMKALLIMVLTAIVSVGAYKEYTEVKTDEVIVEAQTMLEKYDLNGDAQLSEEEIVAFTEDMYANYGNGEFTKDEVESAVVEAKGKLGSYDADNDGDLSYDEQLTLVQDVYKAYDNGEVTDENFKAFLAGYENHVNDLNSYHALLDECGVPGKGVYINLR